MPAIAVMMYGVISFLPSYSCLLSSLVISLLMSSVVFKLGGMVGVTSSLVDDGAVDGASIGSLRLISTIKTLANSE